MRMKFMGSAVVAVIVLAATSLTAIQQEPELTGVITVHEWGTFTSVSDGEGASLDWRPLAGPSDLPSFVYTQEGAPKGLRHGAKCEQCGHFRCSCSKCDAGASPKECGCKSCTVATVRMETPVIYFYADTGLTASVRVDFPKGRITEWYPKAREVGTGINWGGVLITPKATPAYPKEPAPSHYYPARETDATSVRVCGDGGPPEMEKFLFYRGVGTFDLPVRATLESGSVRIRNVGGDEICQAILFENRGGKIGHRIACGLKDEVLLDRPELGRTPEGIFEDLMKILTQQGLYKKEAAAMIQTWRDSWFEEGLRVFYVLPRAATDAILPIQIKPVPKELVRVLVGRLEILTPEMRSKLAELVDQLGAESIETRLKATETLKRYGRFAEPLLKRIAGATDDLEVKKRIKDILGN